MRLDIQYRKGTLHYDTSICVFEILSVSERYNPSIATFLSLAALLSPTPRPIPADQ
jgi:hypothetical protein